MEESDGTNVRRGGTTSLSSSAPPSFSSRTVEDGEEDGALPKFLMSGVTEGESSGDDEEKEDEGDKLLLSIVDVKEMELVLEITPSSVSRWGEEGEETFSSSFPSGSEGEETECDGRVGETE